MRLALACLALLASAAAVAAQPPEPTLGYLAGPFDVASVVAAPPAAGSAGDSADMAGWRAAAAGADGPAWRQAAADDAAIGGPAPALLFACALGVRADTASTPLLTRTLVRVSLDVEAPVAELKARWRRPRPFASDPTAPLCIAIPPERRPTASPTYPSGSAALGAAWALILAELAPDRAVPVLARGRQIGDGRVACRVHYASDVVAGRDLAAAIVARLHGSPEFRADLDRARTELASVRRTGPLIADCA